jgi:hypothetical protein
MVSLTEKYNLRKLCYAIENFETVMNPSTKNNIDYIKRTLLKILQQKGEIDVEYNHSAGLTIARRYSKLAFQALDKQTRNFLLNGEKIIDIDMVSSAPSTLKYLCEQYRITKIPCLTEYVEDKYKIIKKHSITKDQVNYLIFEEEEKDLENKWLRDFHNEILKITKILVDHKDFAEIKKQTIKKKKVEKTTSVLANILFTYEDKFLMEIKKYIEAKGYKVFALQFDGLLVYDCNNDFKKILEDLNKKIKEITENPYLNLSIKPFQTNIVVPDDYKYTEEKRKLILSQRSRDYETVKMMWEDENQENATLIIGLSSYFVKIKGEFKNFSEKSLRTSFRHKKYEEVKKDKLGEIEINEKCFIDKWVDDENIQKKNNIVNYYDKSLVGEYDLNICEPFAVNTWELPDYKYDEEAVNIYRHHLLSLCNFEEKSAEFLEKWIAHLFQMPDIKTGVCVVITGEEGNGKDTAVDFIANIMGLNKRHITSQPEKDVWGHFNSMMANSGLVQLSEIDRMNTNTHMGKIKDFITNPTITIEDKGQKPYTTQSNHNLIGTTNNELPFNIGNKQRRIAIVNASSKYIDNKEYFAKLHKLMEDKNALKSIYEYFMNVKDVPKKFSLDDINVSKYQEEMKENCVEDIIEFMKCRTVGKKTEIERISLQELLTQFTTWRYENKLPNKDWNSKSFGIRMTKLMLIDMKDCIEKKRTQTGFIYKFDYPKIYKQLELKDYFNSK